jgi:holliday junction DNA helicase RuvA
MIYSLRGIPKRVDPFFVVIEATGVGYGVRIPGNVYEAIVNGGYDTGKREFSLVTRSVYSEDNAQLFGFLTEDEAGLFDFIRSLSGFGPTAAMGIISTLGADGLLQALLAADAAALVKVPGVGKTRAEKLVFEAKGKKQRLEKLAAEIKPGKAPQINKPADDLILQALTSLGYSNKEISAADERVRKITDKPASIGRENLQEWIRLYLKNL